MTSSTPLASWTSRQVTVLGEWDGRAELHSEIADRVASTLQAFDRAFGGEVAWDVVGSWAALDPFSYDSINSLVASTVAKDDFGNEHPAIGFEFSVRGLYAGGHINALFMVGSASAGKRKLSNRVLVRLSSSTTREIDSVVLSIAEFWNPAAVVACDLDTAKLSGGRGRFSVPVGERVWLRQDVGSITSVLTGIRAESALGGVLLSTDDSWSPEQVVEAMVEAYASNSITTLPNGPQQQSLQG